MTPSAAVKPTRTKAGAVPTMTEKELSQHIVRAAKDCGWLVARTWLSKFSPAGEPDLRMLKPPRAIVCELKSAKGRLSDAQREWLEAWQGVPGIEVYLVYPEGLEAMYHVLLGQASSEDLERLKP